ncbi:uncharacterized protein LOC126382261 [Pectinophora gossypiella]|uniref:uncharacterized protein LOC126382261 n=1 Tax=Pectinophora gossypiella TaxID=13191 RepID=UPI00214EA3CE|nr:uncharacterized protein LOC126382261 [Pectinophora gossypiella]
MNKKVFILFVLLTLAECVRLTSRQNIKSRAREPRTRIYRPRGAVVEDLFNVYDPSFLAIVWPKISNGVHLFVESTCWRDLSVFFRDLSAGRAWTYSAVDASGRYQSGLFRGNTLWLGSRDECLHLDNRFTSGEGNESYNEFHNSDYLNAVLKKEKYFDGETWRSLVQKDELWRRLVLADNSPPYRLAYTAVQLSLNLTRITMAEAYSITLGVCLPQSCSPEDIASVINFSIMINDNLKSNKTMPRIVRITSLRQIEEYYSINKDIGAILLICVTALLFAIAVTATAVDLKLVKCSARNHKSMSFDLEKFNNRNLDSEHGNLNDEKKKHNCDIIAKKDTNVVDMETLTINNINNSSNINLVTVKKVTKPNVMPPSITLDVVSMERVTGSCKRCGKYKKQCNSNNPRLSDNLPACPRVKSFASLTTEPKRKDKFFKSLLLCFSLSYSWRRIFNVNMANKDLSIIHVLKIVATFWIIFMHVAMIANYVSENGGDINDHNNLYYIIATGTLAFDTLFFVSGLFSSHHFFFLKSQYTVEELVSFGGSCGQVLQFICFVTNRAIRLLPSYVYVIFLSGVAARVTRRTSPLSLPEAEHATCDNYWWRNVLYISTLFLHEDQCMQMSWYMSVETQLHVFGALACALSSTGRRLVLAIAVAAIIVSTAADVSAAYTEFDHQFSSVYALYAVWIERPLARVAPYFVGMFVGWLVIRLEGRMHLSKLRVSVLWLVTLLALVSSLCTAWVFREWVSSWLHVLWPLALLWPAIVSATTAAELTRGILSSPCVAALSRLSYSMLLLHGPVARLLMLCAQVALCSHTVCIWWYFAGTTLVTMCGALLLSLLVETPCCSLLRRLSDYAS